MGESTVEIRASSTAVPAMAAAESAASGPPPPPPPPAHPRRPRVREVSSRFMSPMVSSFSSSSSNSGDTRHLFPAKSPLHKQHLGSTPTPTPNHAEVQSRQRSSSVHRRRRQLDMEPLSCSDENRVSDTEPPIQIQGSETSFPFEQVPSTLRRQRSTKLLKENVGGRQTQQHSLKNGHGKGGAAFATPSRPDTPMLSASFDRTMSVSSRFRLMQQRPTTTTTNVASSAAAKLLQSSVMSLPAQSSESSSQDSTSVPQEGQSSLNALPHDGNHNHLSSSIQSLPDWRSSMRETDMLPTVSGRLTAEKNSNRGGSGSTTASTDSLKLPTFPSSCYLNSPFNSAEGGEKAANALSKPTANSAKMGALCLPPVPPCAGAKPGTDTRKVKKVSSHQEDVHSLKLLYNRYQQWRYANARAEASLQTQQREAETKVNSLRIKISELSDSVTRKRIELGILRRTKDLSTILEAQVPYLDQWSALEGDYSVSLAESIQALLNASIQLPLGGNVRVDIKELQEALNSAMKVMEIIVFHVQHLIPKAEETEILISELARIAGGERALIEECGDLSRETYASQVDEWSLRSQIIQLHNATCLKDNFSMKELAVNN